MKMKVSHPVIIIGMSRSGTSMLTRILDELGLFTGHRLTDNHEAVFFREINDWLLTQCSGGLENPSTFKYLLKDWEARALFGRFINYTMKTPRVMSFLGMRKYLKYRTPANLDVPWGWKDPRNTYTLPFWLDLFPEAKVIHIFRHPLDIINSLRTRRKRGLSRLEGRHYWWEPLYLYYLMEKFIGGKRVFVDLRGADLEEGLLMWEEYMEEARKHVTDLGERAIEIKYEDFLDSPNEILIKLTGFCGLRANAAEIENSGSKVNKSRGLAYLKDLELKAFSERVSDRLSNYGY